jgi:hypothetical protein
MRHRATLVLLFIVMVAAAPGATAAGQRDSMIVSVAWLASHLRDSNLVLLHVGT